MLASPMVRTPRLKAQLLHRLLTYDFKIANDPLHDRWRWLEEQAWTELPQIFNIIRGGTSVGPRDLKF
jgi:hypothetical protein